MTHLSSGHLPGQCCALCILAKSFCTTPVTALDAHIIYIEAFDPQNS